MQRVIMKSKIHRATVTRAVLDFEGSCGISPGDTVILVTDAHLDERELRNFTPAVVRVDANIRMREQAAIA